MGLYLFVRVQQMSGVGGILEYWSYLEKNYRRRNGIYLGDNIKFIGKRNLCDKRVVQRGCQCGKMEFIMYMKNVDLLM